MTDNQNVIKTTMKDVQLQHFLLKRASRMSKMFRKTLFSVLFVCWFFLNRWTSLEARLSVNKLSLLLTGSNYNYWVSYKTFVFPFAIRKLI